MTKTKLHYHWRDQYAGRRFPAAVSLHSHTCHSRESLAFLPGIAHKVPVLRDVISFQERRYERRHRHRPDYSSAFWTPPLNEREALRLERAQIENALGIPAMVSLTDHDTIDAGLHLRLFEDSSETPLSVEWTVPFGSTFFHLGVHNLPPETAPHWMSRLAGHTLAPRSAPLSELLDGLAAAAGVLIVFNHPLWDEKGVGAARHRQMAADFIAAHRDWIHAIELNGLRPWNENRDVAALAGSLDMCLISGGDRHGSEPNANLNLTHASTFAGFVDEIRRDQRSHVLFLPQYREHLRHRYVETVWDVMRDYPAHPGREHWTDRFFYRKPSGECVSLSSEWGGGDGPGVIGAFMALLRWAAREPVRGRLLAALRTSGEVLP